MLTIHDKPIVSPPVKRLVTTAEASAWRGLCWRKMDGEFATATFRAPSGGGKGGLIADLQVEIMRKRSGGIYTPSDLGKFERYGVWHAITDVLSVDGLDIWNDPTRRRWHYARLVESLLRASDGVFLADCGCGGEFAEKCLADGGEGAVFKDANAGYGAMLAVKGTWEGVLEVYDVTGTQSVGIRDPISKQPRGRCKLGGGKCDRVKEGSLIKIMGLCITDDGKVREPRADNTSGGESWLVKL
jgi:hypothetical protein